MIEQIIKLFQDAKPNEIKEERENIGYSYSFKYKEFKFLLHIYCHSNMIYAVNIFKEAQKDNIVKEFTYEEKKEIGDKRLKELYLNVQDKMERWRIQQKKLEEKRIKEYEETERKKKEEKEAEKELQKRDNLRELERILK